MKKLTGIEAIDYARKNDLTLNKYADPTEEARTDMSVDEAEEVATEDPSLIWINEEETETLNPYQHTGRGEIV